MKKLMIILMVIFCITITPFDVSAKCLNAEIYTIKGYFENASNDPVIGKTLSTILFDIFYDDGTTASTGNSATAEMGQGWYRYSYTSTGKSGVWIMRDSGGTYKNFPGGILEKLCDSQLIDINSAGAVDINLDGVSGTLDASEIGTDAITAAKIAAGAITSSEAPNLDVAVSSIDTSITVTAGTGNTATWDSIPIVETTEITINNQYVGYFLYCAKEKREIVRTTQNTIDTISIEPGNPFTTAPDAITCLIKDK